MGHTSFQLDRRQFLKAGLGAAGALAFSPGSLARALAAGPVTVGNGPYGSLQPFDANGIALPAGFRSREIARGAASVPGSSPPYVWHNATDGQATFRTITAGQPDGGWILVANSEMPAGQGGVSAVEFASDGRIERAYRVLAGTSLNCAGGPTPWGKWLSCEERDQGMVHECDPSTLNAGVARPALGVFAHEAACVDPLAQRLYLTEDKSDGCLYRFTPSSYPDLTTGLLEVAVGSVPGTVGWAQVPNPGGGAADPTRNQVAVASRFNGGEGIWFDQGVAYFTTTGDQRVWTYTVASQELEVLYDEAAAGPGAPLSGVDNITVAPSGDIFVCEDRADHDICLITPGFEVSRFLKLDPVMHAGPLATGNETVGVVFSPDGTRMYFGAQRSFPAPPDPPAGVVYEVSGPFRQPTSGGDGSQGGDTRAPGVQVKVARRRRIKSFLRSGLRVGLDLDEPCGVVATLSGERRGGVLARAAPSIALNNAAAVKLDPTRAGAARLRNRRKLTATLEVVATDSAGNTTTVRRGVTLDRRKPGR